jgi:signal transduction histidine kinase
MHPDDVERVAAANIEAFKTYKFNQSYRSFHPLKKEWRWIQAISNGVIDENNKTLFVNGIIIDITDKKRTEEALQDSYDTLEERVKVRTHQLQIANDRLLNEIKERKLTEADLQKSKDKLRLLSNQLINAQEKERKRIAIELHDELGQSLVGLKFQLSRFEKQLHKNQTNLQQDIRQALESIDLMTENVRRLSRDLRPAVLEHLGLFEALQWLFRDFAKKYEITVFKNIQKQESSYTKEQSLIIFRIFQEALTNIAKHAQAQKVAITLTEGGKTASFSIQDNGRGFNPKTANARTLGKSGLGLTAMAERAQMAGGHLEVKSELGKGTVINFTIPLKKRLTKPLQN